MPKSIIKRLPALFALLLFCFVVYLYVDGWFDISFIARGEDAAPPDETGAGTLFAPDIKPETDAHTTAAPGPDETEAGPSAPPETDAPDMSLFTPPAADSADGFSLSYDDFSPGGRWILAEAPLDIGAPGYFSSHTVEKNKVSYVSPGNNTEYQIVYTPYTVNAPAVSLYMGYIIVESEKSGTLNVYSQSGDPIGSFKEKDIAPAYCRDREGRPLFTSNGAYYYLDAGQRRFVLSDYDPVTDNRGALFDYTPSYGKADGERSFVSQKTVENVEVPVEGRDDAYYVVPTEVTRFAISDGDGDPVNDYIYFGAYGFSESLAAVVDADGHLSYVTGSGSTAIKSTKRYRDTNIKRNVIEYFMEPLTNGPESIGFYFFEHGLARARIMTIEANPFDKDGTISILSDEVVVINKNGSRFYIPLGYDAEAYSSGMLLLRGETGVGFMDYTGAWIVDPDLSDAEPFYEGLAVVKKGGSVGLINTAGELVIPYGRYSYISNASSGLIAAYDGEWHILYKMSK